jgi:alpha-D-ribose 1-methylphosphonate 5-triphosphate synthase subunit PhnH
MGERGFLAPVFDSQRVFRSVLTALSEPGRVVQLDATCAPPPPVDPAAAAMVLALCDGDTPLWLAPHLAPAANSFFHFETGAPLVETLPAAQFVLTDHDHRPPLAALNLGTADYPDWAATLILAVPRLEEGRGWSVSGPGIADRRSLFVHGVDAKFADEWQANRSQFPLGVDIVFAARDRIAGLPRSTRLET